MERKICRQLISKEKKQSIYKAFGAMSKNNGQNLNKTEIVQTVAEIFSVSRAEVFKIIGCEYVQLEATRKHRPYKIFTVYDYNFKEDLRLHILHLRKHNKNFTIRDLLQHAKNELGFRGGHTTLWKIIKNMGFKYKKIDGRKVIFERSHVLGAQIRFMRKYIQLLESNSFIFVYLDETWIYQNGSPVKLWVNENDIATFPSQVKGFLDGCDFFLHSQINDRDYHKTMNGDLFKEWVVNQLLPALSKLQRKCVVIFDNAPYHSVVLDKPPTFSSTKSQMQEWLVQHQIDYDKTSTKRQLWDILQGHLTTHKRTYVIDNILARNGHEVLRLPPYHCEYNPIELAWGQCKSYYNKHISSQPLSKDRVSSLWHESISKCTADIWTNNIRHCETLIREDWVRLMGDSGVNDVPPVVINLTESDSESEYEVNSQSDSELDLEMNK